MNRAALRSLCVVLQRLRMASLDALEHLALAEGAGVDVDAVLAAVRMEHSDWVAEWKRMQSVADVLYAMGAKTRLDMLMLTDEPVADQSALDAFDRDAGYLAHMCGKRIDECLYPNGSPAAISWREGWLNARDAVVKDSKQS